MAGFSTPTFDELDAIFAPVREYERLLLAVSGGSDSMALLHLAALWAQALAPAAPQLCVATVDHALRPASRGEAEQVCAAARGLGLEASVLTWHGPKPDGGLQETAREVRYALLGQHAADCGAGAVLTAHTLDDQAETILMRLARGSGPDGLQGMQRVRMMDHHLGVVLVRPLLHVSREQLREFLIAHGVSWIEDPSNDDLRFERVRWRAAVAALHDLGLTPARLALAAQRQQQAVAALEAATDQLAATALDVHGGMFATIDAAVYRSAPSELQVRLFNRVLSMFGGASRAAELAQVERFAVRLATAPATRMTLGGCDVRACARLIRVFREAGRAQLSPVQLKPGEETIWDGRFCIQYRAGGAGSEPVTVRALDLPSAGLIRKGLSRPIALPARAAATLPAAWAGDALVGVGGVPAWMFETARAQALPQVDMHFLFTPAGREP